MNAIYADELRVAYEQGRRNFRHWELAHADLRWLRIPGACLYGANLRGADLRNCDLTGVDLRAADLRCAYFGGADMTDADLRGANLHDVDLAGTCLERRRGSSGHKTWIFRKEHHNAYVGLWY